jgi:hypothetical protein
MIIEATQFHHTFAPGVMAWRDESIIPRYSAAGALQIYSARRFGYDIPASMANQIAWGDVVGACLALLALWLLRRRSVAAVPVICLFIVETALDFLNAAALGIRHHSARTAHDLSWVILNFYVPVLLISFALATWQLITRHAELLNRKSAIHGTDETYPP